MPPPRQAPGPSLELIFETMHGFQRTGALKAALELMYSRALLTEQTLPSRSHAVRRLPHEACGSCATTLWSSAW